MEFDCKTIHAIWRFSFKDCSMAMNIKFFTILNKDKF